jgi:hypothetical protein
LFLREWVFNYFIPVVGFVAAVALQWEERWVRVSTCRTRERGERGRQDVYRCVVCAVVMYAYAKVIKYTTETATPPMS